MIPLPEPRRVAAALRRIDERLQRHGPAGATQLWYKGDEPYFDVFFEIDADGCLRWFQLTFRGRVLTWDGPRDALWTGVSGELGFQPGAPATTLVQPAMELDAELVQFTVAVLAARADEEPFVQAAAALASGI